ncbi:MAG TPA: PAS domain S-box protein [Rhodocyclaceae bacterium]
MPLPPEPSAAPGGRLPLDSACLQSLIETIGVGILLHRVGVTLYANAAWQEITGYSRAELAELSLEQLALPAYRDKLRGRQQDLLTGHAAAGPCAFALQHKSGQVRWLEMSARLTRFEDQPAILATLVDVTAHREAEARLEHMDQVLSQILQGDPVPTFVIDGEHRVTHWNAACEAVTGVAAADIVGTARAWTAFYARERPVMADLIVDGRIEQLDEFYRGVYRRSAVIAGAYEAEAYFPHFHPGGRWLYFTAAPLRDGQGRIIGAIETLQDVTARKTSEESLQRAYDELETLVQSRTEQLALAKAELEADVRQRKLSEAELLRRNADLTELNNKLQSAQEQLVQAEKMASIGQLAAGVAHEINNPIGYVLSNIGALDGYLQDILEILGAFETAAEALPADHPALAAARQLRQRHDLPFIQEDAAKLMLETREGIDRVRKIVADLKDFSRIDTSQEWQWADLHQGLDSTLNIVNNELKYKADVVRQYGDLPHVECLPSQLNQVFMNLLVNAAHAIGAERGTITIRSERLGSEVVVEISDTGSGIPAENLTRIFDPFFTTKPIGQGTGLGLSLSYGIIQKHNGHIDVHSELGRGTSFRIVLPIQQRPDEDSPS